MSYPIIMPVSYPVHSVFRSGEIKPYSSVSEMVASGCLYLFLILLVVAICMAMTEDFDSKTGKVLVWVVASPLIVGLFFLWAMYL